MANSTNIINLFSKALTTPAVQQTTSVQGTKSVNPFNNNPFVTTAEKSFNTYAKNKPVAGGYFAGYYNGKPNIVGQKLFIEV